MRRCFPDLIDKPLGRIIFKIALRERTALRRTRCCVNVAFFCILFFMRGRRKREFALVPISSLLHLAEDGMWSTPKVFWWPLFGTPFPREPVAGGSLAFLVPNDPGALVPGGDRDSRRSRGCSRRTGCSIETVCGPSQDRPSGTSEGGGQ